MSLWVRTTLRRHLTATIGLIVLTVLAATVVAGSVQAARRAETSIPRFQTTSRNFDVIVGGCPPDVNPQDVQSQSVLQASCNNPATAERLRAELAKDPAIGSTSLVAFDGIGIFGLPSSAGWGRLALTIVSGGPDPALVPGTPIVVEGRLPDPAATDEVALTETAARDADLHAGQVLRFGSWPQGDLDRAIEGALPPETTPFTSKVVGVVRYLDDIAPGDEQRENAATLPGGVIVAPGWARAHSADLSGYGTNVAVRLRGGAAALPQFEDRVRGGLYGWTTYPSPIVNVDVPALQRAIDTERWALMIFAGIALVAGAAFVGLILVRQLRVELEPAPTLRSLGVTRRDLRAATIARSLTIGVPAAVLCVAATIAVSPLGPVGLARKIEFELPVRVDLPVVLLAAAFIVAMFAVAGAGAAALAARPAKAPRRSVRLAGLKEQLPPSPRVGVTFIRGASPRAAVIVGAIGIAIALTAGTVAASFDRVIDEPERYGAWWDVVVGNYSDPASLADGAAKVKANPTIEEAAGYLQATDISVGGRSVLIEALDPVVGSPTPVITRGRAPHTRSEIALCPATSDSAKAGIGDSVKVAFIEDPTGLELRVVGIALCSDPVSNLTALGEGGYVSPDLLHGLGPYVAQSIAVRFKPGVGRAAAIDSIAKDFPGSFHVVQPQPDLKHLDRLHAVPWLVAALVGLLAASTLIHALVTMLSRRRRSLGVLSTIGFDRRQRLGVGTSAGLIILAGAAVFGVPLGVILGRQAWRLLANRIHIPSGPVVPWSVALVAVLAGFTLAAVVALHAGWRESRRTPAELLRAE